MKHRTARNRPAQLQLAVGLVRNVKSNAKLRTNTSQVITFNLQTKLARNEQLEGRDYVVVPMVMITEGVHRGSQGPLLYTAEELSKTPQVWNQKPVVVNHPEANGEGLSACDVEVIEKYRVGFIMNTRFDRMNRLKAEAWLDAEKADLVDPRVMEAVENEETMELSTGLFTDNEYAPGEFEGVHYDAIARNLRPDHLALLPDSQGSCSIADGAGFIRNSVHGDKLSKQDAATLQEYVTDFIAQVLTHNAQGVADKSAKATDDDAETAAELQRDLAGKFSNQAAAVATKTASDRTNAALQGGTYALHKTAASAHRAAAQAHRKQNGGKNNVTAAYHDTAGRMHEQTAAAVKPTRNELSFDDVRAQLSTELRKVLGKDTDCWISDVFCDHFIYTCGGKIFSREYEHEEDDDEITLGKDDATEVVRVTSYEPVKNAALTAKGRDKLPASAFVFPARKGYPIHDLAHARNALARSSGKPEEATVKSAVYKKFPALKPTANKLPVTMLAVRNGLRHGIPVTMSAVRSVLV